MLGVFSGIMLLLPYLGRWEAWDFCFQPWRWVQACRGGNWAARQMLCGCSVLRHGGCAGSQGCSWVLFTWKVSKPLTAHADLEVHSALLYTGGSLHVKNHFAHADVVLARSEEAQQNCRNDCGKAFHLLFRAASAAFGMGCSNLPWRGGGLFTYPLPLALHRQSSSSI